MPHFTPPETGLAKGRRYSVIRDPVHGDVYLTHEEVALLDTREMQRLRGVKQLGAAHLVFPGAVHTRFDHSIGVLHCAARMIDAINVSAHLEPRACLAVGEEEARVVRLAALLHDVTHIPLGHALEDQDGIFHRHDTRLRFEGLLGGSTELGRVLRELRVAEDVLGVLTAADGDSAGEVGGGFPPYWSQIVSSTVAADILDYLARDAYFTGLRMQVDPRVTSYFKVDRASGNLFIDLAKHEHLREDILSEIVRLLEARYYFSERVYYHHAKVAAGAMLARAVELALRAGVVDEADFYGQTDDSLLDLLERTLARAEPDARERGLRLVEAYRSRRLYKRACVFPRYRNEAVQGELVERYFSLGGSAARAALEHRISDLVRFATGRVVEVIVYCPAREMQLKEARIHVRWPGEPKLRRLGELAERVPRLADLERSYRDLWKFYVLADSSDPAVLAKVQEVARGELPGATDVYQLHRA